MTNEFMRYKRYNQKKWENFAGHLKSGPEKVEIKKISEDTKFKPYKNMAIGMVLNAVRDIQKNENRKNVRTAIKFLKNYENSLYFQVLPIKKSKIEIFLEKNIKK